MTDPHQPDAQPDPTSAPPPSQWVTSPPPSEWARPAQDPTAAADTGRPGDTDTGGPGDTGGLRDTADTGAQPGTAHARPGAGYPQSPGAEGGPRQPGAAYPYAAGPYQHAAHLTAAAPPGYSYAPHGISPYAAHPGHPAAYPYPYQYGSQAFSPYGYGYGPPARTNGLAIGAMVTSISAVVLMACTYGLSGLVGVVGAVLGHAARRQIRERGEAGGPMAMAGIIVGWIAAALALVALALFVGIMVFGPGGDPEPYTT
jgi:hypothetical protein